MTDPTPDVPLIEGEPTTSIEFDLGPGVFGVDMRMRVRHDFNKAANEPDYGQVAADTLTQLFTLAFAKAGLIAEGARFHVGAIPKGHVSVAEVGGAPAPITGVQAQAAPVAQPTAAGIVAAANGAPVQQNGIIVTYNGRSFKGEPAKPYRTVSLQHFTTEQLEQWCLAEAARMGFDPAKLKVYDERLAGEKGQGISSAANVKIDGPYTQDPLANPNGQKKHAIFRVKFDDANQPVAMVDPHWRTLMSANALGQFAAGAPAQAAAPAAPQYQAPAPQYQAQAPVSPAENPFMGIPPATEPPASSWDEPDF